MEQVLKYMYEVYRTGSISKASENLFVSQPALSTAIKKKEQELGFSVFNRNTLPLTLTVEGGVYMDSLERILEIEAATAKQIQSIKDSKNGKLIIGISNYASCYIVPQIYRNFHAVHPAISVQICDSEINILREKLAGGLLDILFDYRFDEEHFACDPILRERIVLAVPKAFEINQKLGHHSLTVEQLIRGDDLEKHKLESLQPFMDVPFVQCEKGFNIHRQMTAICNESNFRPTIVNSSNKLLINFNLMLAGAGVTFTTDTLLKIVRPPKNACLFYLIDSLNTYRTLWVKYRKSGENKAIRSFMECAANTFADQTFHL